MRHLHWFQNDLRIKDNPALASHAAADSLLCVFLLPKPRPWCNQAGLGPQRDRFMRESLQELKGELSSHGQDLMVLEGSPELVIPDLVKRFGITEISLSQSPGVYERQAIGYLQKKLPIPIVAHRGNTLFSPEQLAIDGFSLPETFTPFRKIVEHWQVNRPTPDSTLPPSPAGQFDAIPNPDASASPALPLPGGRTAGLRRLQQFTFSTEAISGYKATRDCLDGMTGSSTLSPWLANGNLSVREVAHTLFDFEQTKGQTDSTRGFYAELLWREFFHWRGLQDDQALFRVGGRTGKRLNKTFEPRSFARWCAGDTDYPLVNALMRQLQTTGWMSNRGRQIAASCLINELNMDWRFGAAWFEKQLIDYDVGSNYGNWQYIAGVGCDPRGGRHFDIEKQTGRHDPEGIFIKKWQGLRPKQPAFVTDAADWPIDSGGDNR